MCGLSRKGEGRRRRRRRRRIKRRKGKERRRRTKRIRRRKGECSHTHTHTHTHTHHSPSPLDQAQHEVTRASLYYEKATTSLKAAKNTIKVIESRIQTGLKFDEKMQAELNRATEGKARAENSIKRVEAFLTQRTKVWKTH